MKLVLAAGQAIATIEAARVLIITVKGFAGQAGPGLTGFGSVTDVIV